jgi:hypothetical protein
MAAVRIHAARDAGDGDGHRVGSGAGLVGLLLRMVQPRYVLLRQTT